MKKLAFFIAVASAASLHAYEPEPADGSFVSNGVAFAQRGGLTASDYVVTNLSFGASDLARKLEAERDPTVGFTNGTLYVDGTSVSLSPYVPSGDDPAFSNAVVSVVTGTSTNDLAALAEIAGLPLTGAAGTVGGILLLLVAAVLALRKSKADGNRTYFAAGKDASCTGVAEGEVIGGTVRAVGDERIVTWTGAGSIKFPGGVTSARVLLVGGGGAGATGIPGNPSFNGKGGKGGEVVEQEITVASGSAYAIAVGAGGAATASTPGTVGEAGDASAITLHGESVVSAEGGAGGLAPQNTVKNNGADGVVSSITGIETYYGGGGGDGGVNSAGMAGGQGGGGRGGYNNVVVDCAGTDGLGGGGGGGDNVLKNAGGKGGNGTVIIRYTIPPQSPTGIAIGLGAQSKAAHAIQIGEGENSEPYTVRFHDYTILSADGKTPVERMPAQMATKADIVAKIVDGTDSTDTEKALSANMGHELQAQITNLRQRGRYLSVWNCRTGLAKTEPTVNPYLYKTGDYFIVGEVSEGEETNYRPDGTQYDKTVPSAAVETDTVSVNDTYYFDGETWTLLHSASAQSTVAFGSLAGNPSDNEALMAEFAKKPDGNKAYFAAGDGAICSGTDSAVITGAATETFVLGSLTKKLVTFSGNGTITLPAGVTEARILVVGGGGGGGSGWNGAGYDGGGGGGVLDRTIPVSAGLPIAVTVGAGGEGGVNGSYGGKAGGDSSVTVGDKEFIAHGGTENGGKSGDCGGYEIKEFGATIETGGTHAGADYDQVMVGNGGAGASGDAVAKSKTGVDGIVSNISGIEEKFGAGGGGGGGKDAGAGGDYGGGIGRGGGTGGQVGGAGADGYGAGGGGANANGDGGVGGRGVVKIVYSVENLQKVGIAIGLNARSMAAHAVQIGTGTNSEPKTVKFRDWTILDADGKIPEERLPNDPLSVIRAAVGNLDASGSTAADIVAALKSI